MSRARECIRALTEPNEPPLRVLNVCGGHERTIATAGLRNVLAPNTVLVPGPGCPVCVCPESILADAITLAINEKAHVLAFGDMLRVPLNTPHEGVSSLAEATRRGADVSPLASVAQAAQLARAAPERCFVFLAAGFETTMAPIAALVAQGLPKNLFLLLAGRRTWPVVEKLLAEGDRRFDALVAPGHVATIMGAEEWRGSAEHYNLPTAVAGFTPEHLLSALRVLREQFRRGAAELVNAYPESVRACGNAYAKAVVNQVFMLEPGDWRGIGSIDASGFALREPYVKHDARRHFDLPPAARGTHKMPAGCACAQVVLGKRRPDQCPSYGTACTPRTPLGPCMVSDEGVCRIWWTTNAAAA